MKNYVLVFLLLTAVTGMQHVSAQKKDGFDIGLSAPALELKQGESGEVTIHVTRTKAYSKSKAHLGVSSALPKGISLVFEPQEGVIDSSVIKVTVASETQPGTYLLVPSCTINNKNKGMMLKVTVR